MSLTFATVSWFKHGYARNQVDEFFAEARRHYDNPGPGSMNSTDVSRVTFALKRGGYNPQDVDAALDRLEGAFVARERADFIAAYGPQAWMSRLAERAQTLYPRLNRPDGQRFVTAKRGATGYDVAEVDALCKRLIGYFDQTAPITAEQVRTAVFTPRKGAKGYAEGPVDAFLARAVEVLLGVE